MVCDAGPTRPVWCALVVVMGIAGLTGAALAQDTGEDAEPGTGRIRIKVSPADVAPAFSVAALSDHGEVACAVERHADGIWTLGRIPAGAYHVTVSAKGYVPVSLHVVVEPESSTTHEVKLELGGMITGDVRPADARIQILAVAAGTSRWVDRASRAKGKLTYSVGPLPPGTYDLLIVTRNRTAFRALRENRSDAPLSDMHREAVQTVVEQYEKARNSSWAGLVELLHPEYRGPRGETYEDTARMARQIQARASKIQEEGTTTTEVYRSDWTVKLLAPLQGRRVLAVCEVSRYWAAAADEPEKLTGTKHRALTVDLNGDVPLIVAQAALLSNALAQLLRVESVRLMPSSTLAGIEVRAGETSAGHDIGLEALRREALPKPNE